MKNKVKLGIGLVGLARTIVRGILERKRAKDKRRQLRTRVATMVPEILFPRVWPLVESGQLSLFDLKVGVYSLQQRAAVQVSAGKGSE
jgi:hypothetical protein